MRISGNNKKLFRKFPEEFFVTVVLQLKSDHVVLDCFESFGIGDRSRCVGCSAFEFLHYCEDEACREEAYADEDAPEHGYIDFVPQ